MKLDSSPKGAARVNRGTVRQLDAEMRGLRAVDKRQCAAMRLHEFGGDDEAETRAALFGRALKRLEQIFARLLRNAGAVVRHIDDHLPALAMCGDADFAVRLVLDALDGLHRIADEVAQRPEQMLVIGINAQRGIHVGDERD